MEKKARLNNYYSGFIVHGGEHVAGENQYLRPPDKKKKEKRREPIYSVKAQSSE